MESVARSPALRHTTIVTLALLACLSAASVPAAADPEDRLDVIERRQGELQQKIEKADAERHRLLGKIGEVDADRAQVESTIADLDSEIDRLGARISVVAGRLQQTQQELAVLTAHLHDVEAKLARHQRIFTSRAIETYKAGPTAYLEGLLSSESFGDLVNRYSYYESALAADQELIDGIELLRSETSQQRTEVEEKEEQIALDKRRLEADRAAVADIRAQKANALAVLEDVLDQKENLLAGVEARKSHYEAVQDQLERESNQIENLLAARASSPPAGGPAPAPTAGFFTWPAAGPVVSPFGYRIHPIFGDRRLHSGIDIAAPYGATVVAAGDGLVAFTGVMSGYGNVVVIDHGGGVATTYNHLSAFSVGRGQRVSRGSPIAAVGCTGYCTGPHLHFEVRIRGVPVDPMPYLR
jgi:murein DD-endopeptidase MepM/ murein hydrolase activator NlpD